MDGLVSSWGPLWQHNRGQAILMARKVSASQLSIGLEDTILHNHPELNILPSS